MTPGSIRNRIVRQRLPAAAGVSLGFAAALLSGLAGAAEPPNLVANGDFRLATGGKPDRWVAEGDAKDVTQTLRAAAEPDGTPSARLECTRCDPRSPSSHAMLALVGGVSLVKGRMYEFSCRMRAEGMKGGSVDVALSDTKTWTNAGLYASLGVGAAWKAHRRVFTATQDFGASGRLQIWFHETGTLCVAGVRIAECAQQEVAFTKLAPPSETKNLVFNGSFEVGKSGWSSMGAGAGWGDLAGLHGEIVGEGGSHGASFLRIPMGGGRTPELFFDYYEPVARRELRPLAASRGWIPVEKGAAYTLSCDMRASVDGTPAILGVRSEDPAGGSNDYRTSVKLAAGWKRYTCTFRPAQRYVFAFAGPDLARDQDVNVDLDAVQLEKGEAATDFQPSRPVEVALSPSIQDGLGMVRREDNAASAWLTVSACNHTQAPVRVQVSFRVTDFDDTPVPMASRTVDVPAGGVRHDTGVVIPPEWKGYHQVQASAECGGKPVDLGRLRLASVPAPSSRDTVFGINHAFAPADLIREAAGAGVTWYRDWSLKWQHLEPEPGTYRWEVGDRQIDRVLREKRNVLPLLPPFPSADWSSEAPAALPAKGYPGVRLKQAFAPKDPALLADFVGKAVDRYKDRIHIWEFLNEPVYTDYALPRSLGSKHGGRDYTPADYVALLKTAAAAMKKADPACKVMGGFAGDPGTLTKEGIEAGLLDAIDILNLHIYPGARQPEGYIAEMDALIARMDAKGQRKPVWMTEFSYYAADDLPRTPFFPSPHDWAEERLLESEKQCAEYTVRFFAVMMSRGVEKIFLHSGASGRVNRPNYECALFAEGGAPRKLFPALAVYTRLMGAQPRFAGERRLGEAGYAMAFETGTQCVLVLWLGDPAARGSARLPPSDGMSWQDVMGRPVATTPVRLSTSPVYLAGPAGKGKEWLASLRLESP
jgi:hypothetical protein